MAAHTPVGKPPPQSLAAGRDYGVLSRIRVNGKPLEMPNASEALAIADVRLYSVVAKVYVPDAALMPARSVLKTHCIAFVHDAPKLISKELFSKKREQDMLDAVQIVLLGPRCKLTTLERKALFNRNFALRPS